MEQRLLRGLPALKAYFAEEVLMARTYEIRDPIHGFVTLNEWERDIVNHPVFQRLRRIRQLGLTDMVYPGAMHSRFEHSLGVMHMATRMFKHIQKRREDFLKSELNFNKDGLGRDCVLVALAINTAIPFSICRALDYCSGRRRLKVALGLSHPAF